MDPLILKLVIRELREGWIGAIWTSLRQESAHRWRLHFESRDGESLSLLVSLAPGRSWIGRPRGRWPGPSWSQPPLHRQAEAAFDRPIEAVDDRPGDRWLSFRFAGGPQLVVELPSHGANLILVGAEGEVLGAARRRSGRVEEGEPYRRPELPGGLLDLDRASAEELDAALAESDGERLPPSLRALGKLGWQLARGQPGAWLRERLDRLEAWSDMEAVWPWRHGEGESGSALALAGRENERLDRTVLDRERHRALHNLLRQEAHRAQAAAGRASADRASFAEPERYGRLAEALLAAAGTAERDGDHWVVPDPYGGPALRVPAHDGLEPAALAERLYDRQRRAKRGVERAREREESMRARARRLTGLVDLESLDALEASMRAEGIAVGLSAPGKRKREAARSQPLRTPGVRLFTSREGEEILVGKGGRDNDRLTFKIAGPEDFWFHAQGAAGAHVVVRSGGAKRTLSKETIREAAALAAWFSKARDSAAVDVVWTRRKYVRRVRRGAPGQVVLKRFETERVRPACPPSADQG